MILTFVNQIDINKYYFSEIHFQYEYIFIKTSYAKK